jgi:hypothetical protein
MASLRAVNLASRAWRCAANKTAVRSPSTSECKSMSSLRSSRGACTTSLAALGASRRTLPAPTAGSTKVSTTASPGSSASASGQGSGLADVLIAACNPDVEAPPSDVLAAACGVGIRPVTQVVAPRAGVLIAACNPDAEAPPSDVLTAACGLDVEGAFLHCNTPTWEWDRVGWRMCCNRCHETPCLVKNLLCAFWMSEKPSSSIKGPPSTFI